MSEYLVRVGDNLSKIAAAHNLTLDALLKENPQIKNPRLIYAGQKIALPAVVAAPPNAAGKGLSTPHADLRQMLLETGKDAEALGDGSVDQTAADCAGTNCEAGCLDDDGYLKDVATRHHIGEKESPNKLEQGDLKKVNAIVLHRTAGSTSSGALSSFTSGVGTHFLIDKDGTVLQTASLNKYTYHVGKIRARCQEEKNCTEDDAKTLDKLGFAPTAISNHESKKSYPDRYPTSADSVGIEVVAAYNEASKTWEGPTVEQQRAIAALVDRLKACYSLNNEDIYEHDKISRKTAGEGAGLYDR